MAAAAVMVTSPSSLLGGEIAGNQAEKPTDQAKSETSDSKSDPTVDTVEGFSKDVKEQQDKQESSTKSSTEKPDEFSNTTKNPPRMSSVDDYTMLPEGYVPKDEDVICSWARQNVSWICLAFYEIREEIDSRHATTKSRLTLFLFLISTPSISKRDYTIAFPP